MGLTGLVIGAVLGLAITRSVVGAVIGAIIGYMIESGARSRVVPTAGPVEVRAEFFHATFAVMGHVAKADGRVSEAEIDAARSVMHEFQLNAHETAAAMEYYRAGKANNFAPQPSLERLLAVCGPRYDLLRHFLELQLRAALHGNGISPPVRSRLMRVAEYLGFTGLEFASMEAAIRGRYARGPSDHGKQKSSLAECYAELEVEAGTTDSEVTKAYRRQMSRHHPDKLVANGLPESMAQMAKEKTQRIQEAYEEIRAARGMH